MIRTGILILLFTTLSFRSSGQYLSAVNAKKDSMAWHTEGDITFIDFNVNSIPLLKQEFPMLQGKDITLCLKENAPSPEDPDIKYALESSTLTSSVASDHATTLATILVGEGVTSPQNTGIAPEAKLIAVDFSNLIPELTAFYDTHKISIVNHSYGTAIENFYGSNSRAYDASVESLPHLLHIFSAGNLGYAPGTASYDGLAGFANLTGNFKQSKNTLTVGAVDAEETPRPWSSAGPAFDGRLKPEVCAFSDEGTSGSAAVVSGIAALLQEYYYHTNNNTYPDAALVKAVLINSATDVGLPGIDWQTGYGNVNAFQAVKTLEQRRFIKGSLSKGDDLMIPLVIPLHAKKLKVTLTWTDPAATVNCAVALVNDLDLEIIDTEHWLPWVLNSYPQYDSLRKPATRGYDHLNTTEQVTLENPDDGSYSIHVTASKTLIGQQPFYIVYQWDVENSFQWIAPLQDITLSDNNLFILRWKCTFATTTGNLEFSTNDGNTWNVIQANVLLAQQHYHWQLPTYFTRARLRMVIDGHAYSTHEFTISPALNPIVTYHCADSVQLQWRWQRGDSINDYHVVRYDGVKRSWKNCATTTTNTITFHDFKPTDVFALIPVHSSGVEGLRSEAVILKDQHVFCFYKNITATVLNDSIQLQCELSSIENIQRVAFQKQRQAETIIFYTTPVSIDEPYYTIHDKNLQDGMNIYRIQLTLKNGRTVYSDFATAFYAKENFFLLYPNPVDIQGSITVIAKESNDYSLTLMNTLGQPVFNQEFFNQQNEISLSFLTAGIYLYTIHSGNQQQTGRIIIK